MSSFLELTQLLHSEAVRSTPAPTSVTGASARNARLFAKVNQAWKKIQSERDWKWMREILDKPLTTGLQTYSGTLFGATRFGRWRREDNEYSPYCYVPGSPNGLFPLNYWDVDDFRYLYIYRQVGPTIPVAWSVDESQNLLIGPAPADAYQLRIDQWKEPFDLVDDGDEPDMPSRFQEVIVWRALMNVAREDATPEIFDKALSEYSTLYAQLLRDQARLPR